MEIEQIWNEAVQAGQAAGQDCKTSMMVLVGHGQRYEQPEGPCGFAWLVIKPARGPLVKYLKSKEIGDKHVYGGWNVWIRDYNQSMERKEAHAQAMAKVLMSHGFDVFADSRWTKVETPLGVCT